MEDQGRYLRQRRRARSTGVIVEIYDTQVWENVFDPNGGRWVTICEHGSLVNHLSLALARAHAADPAVWCDECREIEQARRTS